MCILKVLTQSWQVRDPKYSQTLVLEHLGSHTIRFSTQLFTEKMSRLSNKTSGLNSLPDNPFLLISEWSGTCLSGDRKGRFRVLNKSPVSNRSLLKQFPEQIKFEDRGSTTVQGHQTFPSQSNLQSCGSMRLQFHLRKD